MAQKILFITSTFPTKETDRQNPWMSELIKHLKKRHFKIEVLAPAFKGKRDHVFFGTKVFRFRYAPAFLENLTHGEGALFKLRKKPWLVLLPFFYLFFGTIKTIQLCRREKYDIVHVHWPFPQAIFGVVAKFFTKTKLVYTFYGAEFALMRQVPLGKDISRFLTKQADQVIAISHHTKKAVQKLVPVEVEVVPFTCGFSQKPGKTVSRKSNRKSEKEILFVGRLVERKGIPYLIKAMPRILESFPARLDIIGGGLLITQLKRQVKKLGLTKKVTVHGRVSERKLLYFYQNCDVFVLPSITDRWGDTEGLGVVLLEAMSFKKPVVASRVGGITDIIKPEQTGLLVPQKNAPLLAKAIIRVLGDKRLSQRLARKGHRYLQEKFAWKKIVDQIEKIYSA